MPQRLFALVAPGKPNPKIRHYEGLPVELTEGDDTRRFFPRAEIIMIVQEAQGAYLERFLKDGQIVGDTWHATIEEAFSQAAYEFGQNLEWQSIQVDSDSPYGFLTSY